MFLFTFLAYTEFNYCLYKGSSESCPAGYKNIDLKKPEQIDVEETLETRINIFLAADTDTSKRSECIFDSVIMKKNFSKISIKGSDRRRTFSFEPLIQQNPRLDLEVENVTFVTKSAEIITKTAVYKNSVFQSEAADFILSASELDIDAASLENIGKLKSENCKISAKLFPSEKTVSTYVETSKSNLNITLTDIESNIFFDVKYHGFDVHFKDDEKITHSLRFIPKPTEEFRFSLGFNTPNRVVEIQNYMVSKTPRLASIGEQISFNVKENTTFVLHKSQWDMNMDNLFNVKTSSTISLKTVTKMIPFSLQLNDNEINIDLNETYNDYYLDFGVFTNSKVNIHGNQTKEVKIEHTGLKSSTIDIDSNVYAVLDELHFDGANLTGDGTYVLGQSHLVVTNTSIFVKNALLSGETVFHMDYEEGDTTSFYFENITRRRRDSIIKLDVTSSSYTAALENIVSSPNKDICTLVQAVPNNEERMIFEPKCVEKDGLYILSFYKLGNVGINGYYCIVNNETEAGPCPDDYKTEFFKDFKLSKSISNIKLFVVSELLNEDLTPGVLDLETGNSKQSFTITATSPDFKINVNRTVFNELTLKNVAVHFVNEDMKLSGRVARFGSSSITGINLFECEETHFSPNVNFSFKTFDTPMLYIDDMAPTEIIATQRNINVSGMVFTFSHRKGDETYLVVDATKSNILNLKLYGEACKFLRLSSNNPASRLFIESNVTCDSLCNITWGGTVTINDAKGMVPVDLHVIDCMFYTSQSNDLYIAHLHIDGKFTPYLRAPIYTQKIVLEDDGKIVKPQSKSYNIYTDELVVETPNFQNSELVTPKSVHIAQTALTNLQLASKEEIFFDINYSVSSIPYLEVNQDLISKGKIVLNCNDESTDLIFERTASDIHVDVLCSLNLDCNKWNYQLTQTNKSSRLVSDIYSIECTTGMYNPSMKCLSLVPKRPPIVKEPLKGWEIALIVIGSVAGFALLVFGVIKGLEYFKRSIELRQLLLYKDFDSDSFIQSSDGYTSG